MFHIRLQIKHGNKFHDLTKSIYSDAGSYKFFITSIVSGELYIYKTPDTRNDWKTIQNIKVIPW